MADVDTLGTAHRRPLPLVGTLLGLAVLAAAALVLPHVAPPGGMLVLAGAGAGFFLWLLALAAGLRRGPLWWTAVSLALLVVGGALAGYNAMRIGLADASRDASTFAELELTPEVTPILPSNPARGPLSTAYAELVRADERAARAQAANLANLNLGVLNSPYLLGQAPAVLDNCPAIGTLAETAARVSGARAERVTALAQAVESANLSSDIKQGIATLVAPPDGASEALLGQARELWQATQSLCDLLAKRTWSNANGYFAFTSAADKKAFDTLNQRRVAVESERKRVGDTMKARFEQGREQVRSALS